MKAEIRILLPGKSGLVESDENIYYTEHSRRERADLEVFFHYPITDSFSHISGLDPEEVCVEVRRPCTVIVRGLTDQQIVMRVMAYPGTEFKLHAGNELDVLSNSSDRAGVRVRMFE